MGDIETTLEINDYGNDPDAKDLAGADRLDQVLVEFKVKNNHNGTVAGGMLWLREINEALREHGFEVVPIEIPPAEEQLEGFNCRAGFAGMGD
jgi:hypothetical protein